jgi:hypothetical protein
MFAFVDETGNTGANIFDENQPLFLTAALVTKSDFDIVYGTKFKRILKQNGLDNLHASVLGFGPLEAVAQDILKLLKSAESRFFISRVEKRYLVATKFFDTFFDSGENPAVPWTAYNIRPLRLILAFKVASLLDVEVSKLFWTMLLERSKSKAHAMIPSLCDAIIQRVGRLPDQRSRQVITDAMQWSKDHPEALDFHTASRQAQNGHMPNMVAFTNLLDGLEKLSKSWGRKLRRVTHDRQSQFETSLAEWHRLFSNASPEPITMFGETYVLQKVGGSDFLVSSSSESAGIQIADLILWIFKRFLESKDIPYHSSHLLAYVMRKGWQNDFSFEGVHQAMIEQFGPIMQADLADEQMKNAKEFQQKVENRRLQNIALYEKDGLMPFERSS